MCNGRFYQGYRMKEGDAGEIVFKNSPLDNLCLWKFIPSYCLLSFSCSQFSVSSGSDQASCSSKMITKVEGESARRWCGKVEPPQEDKQMVNNRSLLVGYFALHQSFKHQSDLFKCKIGCHRPGTILPTYKPTSTGGDLKCSCGVPSSSRARRGLSISRVASLSRAFHPALILSASAYPSPSLRIVGGTLAVPGSVPWQASLAISGEIFCGASLVTDRHLVTAAHCTVQIGQSVLDQVDILLNLYNREDTRKLVKQKIQKIVNHPEFDDENLANDISVITLRSSLRLEQGTCIYYKTVFM